MISKWILAGVAAGSLGGFSLLMETVFYGYVNEQAILHESMFLPLGVFLVILGIVLLVIGAIRTVLNR